MDKTIIPGDLINIVTAGEITQRGEYFFLLNGAKKKIKTFFPYAEGMGIFSPHSIEMFLRHGGDGGLFKTAGIIYLREPKQLHVSKQEAISLSMLEDDNENSALSKLTICDIEMLIGQKTSRQKDEGFSSWKKNIEKKFHKGISAGVAVVAYCIENKKKLTKEDLVDLLQRPQIFPGAKEIEKFSGLPNDLIEDIYRALPAAYRHGQGEKKAKHPKP